MAKDVCELAHTCTCDQIKQEEQILQFKHFNINIILNIHLSVFTMLYLRVKELT